MELFGRRLSFVAGLVMGLLLQSPAHAQSQACEGFFQIYSKSEIVDVLVYIRDSWMSLAGAQAKQEMLGKADNIYISPATVCRDLALAGMSPIQLEEGLKKQRTAREEKERWFIDYRKEMLTRIAEIPKGDAESVGIARVAANEREPDTNRNVNYYDIKAHCRKIADIAGGSYQIEETCRKGEQEARKDLTTITIPSRISQHCQEIGAVAGGSYQIMLTCVKKEIEAKDRL